MLKWQHLQWKLYRGTISKMFPHLCDSGATGFYNYVFIESCCIQNQIADSPTCAISFEDIAILAFEHRMRKRRILDSLHIQDFSSRGI